LTVGGVLSKVTTAASEAVQPLDVLVAVTIYVPALLTVMEAVVAPPGLHTKVVPEEAVAVKVTEVTTQVSTLSGPALTVGGTVSMCTTATSEAVHPLEILVAVTV
jgi:hypothetical protein